MAEARNMEMTQRPHPRARGKIACGRGAVAGAGAALEAAEWGGHSWRRGEFLKFVLSKFLT